MQVKPETQSELPEVHLLWSGVLRTLACNFPDLGDAVSFYQTRVLPVGYDGKTLVLAVPTPEDLTRKEVGGERYIAQALAYELNQSGTSVLHHSSLVVSFVSDPSLFSLPFVGQTNESSEDMQSVESSSRLSLIEDDSYKTLYQRVVQPNRIVSISRGLLRWLPYLGPTRSSMIVSLLQASYSKTETQFGSNKIASVTFKEWSFFSGIDMNTIAEYCDERVFRYFFKKVEIPEREKHIFDPKRNKIVTRANQYSLRMDVPLTPGDESALVDYLEAKNLSSDPEGVLLQALQEKRTNILPRRYSPPSPNWLSEINKIAMTTNENRELVVDEEENDRLDKLVMPHSVSEIIHSLLGSDVLSDELEELVAKFSEFLLPENNAFLLIPWYRFQQWTRVFGSSRLWFTILCRDRVYFNTKTDEYRSSFHVDGGFDYFADYLGIEERTVRRWFLSETNAREKISLSSLLEKFVTIENQVYANNKVVEMDMKVEREEPLTPDHESFIKNALSFSRLFINCSFSTQKSILESVQKFLDAGSKDDSIYTEIKPARKAEQQDSKPAIKTEMLNSKPAINTESSNSKPATNPQVLACESAIKTDLLNDESAIKTEESLPEIPSIKELINNYFLNNITLNHLKHLHQHSLDRNDLLETSTSKKQETVVAVDWNVSDILKNTFANKTISKEFSSLSAPSLISFLLYGASKRGESTKAGYIISQLRDDVSAEAVWPYNEIAKIDRVSLEQLIKRAYSGGLGFGLDSVTQLWNKGMKDIKKEKLEELAARLGISLESHDIVVFDH